MRRVVIPELLDSDSGSAEEIRASLRDLRNVNRWFGGTSTLISLLERIAARTGKRSLSLLDVGAGPGEAAIRAAESTGVRVTLLDRATTHLPRKGVPAVAGDAMSLPFRDGAFDVISSSLFIHHLEPEQIIGCVNESLRVCREAVIINDLHRSAAHLALVYAGIPLFRSRMTRHDSVASVKRAYTPDELRTILSRTRAANVEISSHYLFRIGVIVWKEPRG